MIRRGFSLIELLVAIGIVSLLIGLVLASIQSVRESARRADCQNRLRQQALAVFSYESAHGRLPPGAIQGPFDLLDVPSGASHGLWPILLAHLDQKPLAEQYRFQISHDHPSNRAVTAARFRVVECGLSPQGQPVGWTNFAPLEVNPFLADIGLIDPATKFESALPVNGKLKLTAITDGTSNTLLLAEASDRPDLGWASPSNLIGLREFFPGPGGPHRGGTNVVMADGSTRFLRDTIDLRILGRLATRAGGEPVTRNY